MQARFILVAEALSDPTAYGRVMDLQERPRIVKTHFADREQPHPIASVGHIKTSSRFATIDVTMVASPNERPKRILYVTVRRGKSVTLKRL